MALLTNINGKFSVSDAGAVTFNNAFTFPTADGSPNYVLKTNGSGQLAWGPDNDTDYDYWILQGDSAANININSTNTLKFVGGTYMDANATWAGGTNPRKLTINHENTSRSDTTSTDEPAFGGTFEAVTSVTTNATGHVTAIDVSTVTIPSDSGYVTGSGTLNKVVRWTATGSTVGDGPITFSGATSAANSTFGGNVGIGGAPSVNFEVNKTGARIKLIDGTNQLNMGLWDGSNYRFEGDANRPMFFTSYQGNINFGISGGTTMTIQSGKVGIGTTLPTTALTIRKAIPAAASSYGLQASMVEFKSYYPGYDTETVKSAIYSGVSDQTTLQTTKGFMSFWTSSEISPAGQNLTEKMRIEANGNVGIGETSVDARLHISALASNGISNVKLESPGASKWAFGIPAGQTYFALDDVNDNLTTPKLVVLKTSGNVGIGTTSPTLGKLQVVNNSQSTSALTICNEVNGGDGFVFQKWQYVENTSNFRLDLKQRVTSGVVQYAFDMVNNGTGYTSVLVLDRGNVGIGTTSPPSKLSLEGAFPGAGFGININNTGASGAAEVYFENDAQRTTIGLNTGDNFVVYDNTSATTRMQITPAGQIQFPRTGQPPITNSLYGNIVLDSNAVTNFQRIRYDVGTTPYWGLTRLNTGNFAITGGSTWNDHALEIDYTTQNVFIDQKLAVGQTTAPGRMLEVNGGTTNDGGIKLTCSANLSNFWSGIEFRSSVATSFIYMASNDADGTLQFLPDASLKATLSKAGTWTVAADVVAYGSPSDKRLKENIKPIQSALDKVSKLQGVTFDWIQKEDQILDIKEDIGFIAQDVQKVIPELVRENDNGMLSMRHQGISPILLEAIKELKAEIEGLKKCKCDCKR